MNKLLKDNLWTQEKIKKQTSGNFNSNINLEVGYMLEHP
jgi:hypothetical protein